MIINIILWNCRRAGDRGTLLYLLEMTQSLRPSIVGLLEMRVHSREYISKLCNTGMMDTIIEEARGFLQGIWLMWNRQEVDIERVASNNQMVSVLVKEDR